MSDFTSSSFFPSSTKHKSKEKSSLHQCIDSGFPVFARDLNASGSKTFFGCGYDHFITNWYSKQVVKNVYELVQFHKPTKIYMDFDHKVVSDRSAFDKSIDDFTEVIRAKLPKDTEFLTLMADTPTKLSRHIIVQVFLENVTSVKDFLLCCLESCRCPYLDMSVYSRNRSFRLPYSKKLGADAESTLLVHGQKDYDTEVVFKSLIQAYHPPPRSPFYEQSNKAEIFRPACTVSRDRETNPRATLCTGTNAPPKLKWFFNQYDDGVLLSLSESDTVYKGIVGGTKCPWKQSCHQNNNQFLTINKNTFSGYLQCADPDCPKTPYLKTDFLWAFMEEPE
jgi:hypothetical protein